MSPQRSAARRSAGWWYASWLVVAAMDVAAYWAMGFNVFDSRYWDVSRLLANGCIQVAALLLWRSRPGNRVGPLLFGFCVVGMASNLVYVPNSVALVVGWLLIPVSSIMLGHALLIFPDGHFHHRIERVLAVVAYAVTVGMQVPSLLVSPTHWLTWCQPAVCPANPLLIRVDSPLAYALDDIGAAAEIAIGLVFVPVLWHRIRRATPAARRAYRPSLVVIGVLVVTFVILQRATWMPGPHAFVYGAATYAQLTAAAALPLCMAYGLLRARLSVADLVTRLELCAPESVGDELAAFLGDRTLRVTLRRANGDVVDLNGRSVDPEPPGQAETMVDTRTWLLHDPALLDDPALLTAVAAAARLTLDKARLQAEVRAQLREAQESRARLARAALDERRRIERDLHDGTQQRLIGVGLTIEHARKYIGDPVVVAQALDEAATEVGNTLTELRELARGLRPALLVERGLSGAIPVLTRRTPLPVRCDVEVATRLSDEVEATVYFVVSEALQNVVKHANASHARVLVAARSGRLRVEVSDDGVGGAVARAGSGLHGLADRVAAVGGVLAVASPAGGGTVIQVDVTI